MKSIGLVPELAVRDLKIALDFYLNLLGFEILYDRPESLFAYLKQENAEIMLHQFGQGRDFITKDFEYPLGRGVNFQIEVTNVDLIYNRLIENEIKIFLPMEEKWYRKNNQEVGNRQFCVQDPDGYLLRFFTDLGKRPTQ
jgi:catechol 2,3-dioxygenase-like lactoylglutathione lyase family enzyme